MKRIIALAIMAVAVYFVGGTAMAVDESAFNPICSEGGLDENQKIEAGCDEKSKVEEGTKRIVNLVNIAIGLSGGVAAIAVVFGGQRYLTSAGDPGKAKQAKDMVMYGVIGMIVAGLAWAIVNFVITGTAVK